MGLKVPELMPPKEEPRKAKAELRLVDTYDYRDEIGTLLFQKLRFVDENGKKTFRQRQPDGKGGWKYHLEGVDQVLYNLPKVLSAKAEGDIIFVVEGEKDVETLESLGYTATTMPGGAGKWRENHSDSLTGANVVIIADNDTPGKKHALDVKAQLESRSCTITLLIPDGVKDITDHIEAGGTVDDLREFTEELDIPVKEDPYTPVLAKIEKILLREDLSDVAKISRASSVLLDLQPETTARPTGRLISWVDLIDEAEDLEYDWIIPNLLERGERVMVVAAEGVGKTMLARQVALCSSAGIHPFTFEQMKPITTLTVDLENPQRIIRRTSSDIARKALHYGFTKNLNAHILIKPDGLDLLSSGDRMILEDAIEQIKPDLVLLGPIYKSFVDPGNRTSEAVAIEVAKYFDSLREWFKCGLWLEHHAPLGSSMSTRDLRPFGSAVWSRWPEFGLSLTPDPTATEGYVYDVRHFRGARDRRQFPVKMTRGLTFPFEVLEFAKME
jgi:5S rRNA maturation endonuclease (ribonuclease M5)